MLELGPRSDAAILVNDDHVKVALMCSNYFAPNDEDTMSLLHVEIVVTSLLLGKTAIAMQHEEPIHGTDSSQALSRYHQSMAICLSFKLLARAFLPGTFLPFLGGSAPCYRISS